MTIWLVVMNLGVMPLKVVEFKFGSPEECAFVGQMLVLQAGQFAMCLAEAGAI